MTLMLHDNNANLLTKWQENKILGNNQKTFLFEMNSLFFICGFFGFFVFLLESKLTNF